MKRIKASPYLTSGIFFLIGGIVILLLNPFNIHRYKFVESSACFDLLANGQSLYAYDLDFDGNSEFIKFKTNTVGESSFVIYDQFKIDHGQEDFNGNYHEGWVNRFFGDFDNNGLGEVYFCRLTGDWLSLTVTEFGGDGVQTIRDRPIIQLKDSTNLGDTPIHIRELVDLNNDGFKELILSANAGYSLQPRSIFLYDIHLDSIVPFTWYKNKVGFTLAQASERNNLGKIFLTDHGPENLDQDDKAFMANKTIPLVVDYCGRPIGDWQTVHIDTLDYMVYLPGFEGEESVIGIGMGTNHKTSWAYAWNHLGHLVDSIQLLANGVAMGKVGVIKELTNGEVIVKGVDGSIVMLLKGLRIKVLRKVSPNWSYRGVIDLNDDGINEVLGREGLSNLVVYDINFKHETSAELLANTEDPSRFRFSKFYVDGKPQLMVLTGPEAQFFIYKSNPMTWLQFLIFLAIMGFVWLLIYIIRYQQREQIYLKQKEKEDVLRLQYQVIMNQINPHFNYNILNNVGYAVLNEDRNKAYKMLADYSLMTRKLLEGSRNLTQSFSEELEFVELYLKFQKERFGENFEYSIQADSLVDLHLPIPKMMIHTFVENAIKHGLAEKEGIQKIAINLKVANGSTVIQIMDNGIGRKSASRRNGDSTGRGLNILDQVIEMFNEKKKHTVVYKIIDLDPDDEMTTKVEIKIT